MANFNPWKLLSLLSACNVGDVTDILKYISNVTHTFLLKCYLWLLPFDWFTNSLLSVLSTFLTWDSLIAIIGYLRCSWWYKSAFPSSPSVPFLMQSSHINAVIAPIYICCEFQLEGIKTSITGLKAQWQVLSAGFHFIKWRTYLTSSTLILPSVNNLRNIGSLAFDSTLVI